MTYDYIKDPAAIYKKSFALVDEAIGNFSCPDTLRPLVKRLVHTAGDPGILPYLSWSHDFHDAACSGLRKGLFVDAEMVAAGITSRFLPDNISPICTLNDPATMELAATIGTTRSAAATELWDTSLDGALVSIGNAPTALFHLLEGIEINRFSKPAAIIGMAVGFVGAAESKQALVQSGLPYLVLTGTRGGSAYAAAAVNAIALDLKGESQE